MYIWKPKFNVRATNVISINIRWLSDGSGGGGGGVGGGGGGGDDDDGDDNDNNNDNNNNMLSNTVEPLYKGHSRWWPFKRGGLSWRVK